MNLQGLVTMSPERFQNIYSSLSDSEQKTIRQILEEMTLIFRGKHLTKWKILKSILHRK